MNKIKFKVSKQCLEAIYDVAEGMDISHPTKGYKVWASIFSDVRGVLAKRYSNMRETNKKEIAISLKFHELSCLYSFLNQADADLFQPHEAEVGALIVELGKHVL